MVEIISKELFKARLLRGYIVKTYYTNLFHSHSKPYSILEILQEPIATWIETFMTMCYFDSLEKRNKNYCIIRTLYPEVVEWFDENDVLWRWNTPSSLFRKNSLRDYDTSIAFYNKADVAMFKLRFDGTKPNEI